MATSQQKEWKKILKALPQQGWRVELTKAGWRCYAPDGKHIVHVHGTPSDHRALENTLSNLRPYGFKWKGH